MKLLCAVSIALGLVGCSDSHSDPDAATSISIDSASSPVADAATNTPDARDTTPDAMPTPDAAPACAGTAVANACWYKGNTGESCTDVCAIHGGFDQATITFAGSTANGDRSNSDNCSSVITALAASTYTAAVDNINETNDYGCVEEPGKSRSELISVNSTVEGSSNAFAARICACNN